MDRSTRTERDSPGIESKTFPNPSRRFLAGQPISQPADQDLADEKSLIRAAIRGNLNAFNLLANAYQEVFYNQAYYLLGEPEAAADITQNALISAYHHLKSFRGGSFRGWLLRIVTNACFDELRRRKRFSTVPLDPVNEGGEELESPRWRADPGESPEERMMQAELRETIQGCLNQLPTHFRDPLMLVDIQGLDYVETATVLGKPLGTIKSRIYRARSRLRSCLECI